MSKFQNMQVNKKIARLNALWVLVFALIFILFPVWRWLVFVLLVNFLVMGFFGPWHSPISQLNKSLLGMFKVEPIMIFAQPKIFAAKVGFVFSLVASVLYLLNLPTVAVIVVGVLGLFAFLELAFEFCAGCWMYEIFHKVF